MNRKTRLAASAFTLPEVLVSTGIAAFVFSGFFLCLTQGMAISRVARENQRATQLLQRQMETIRLYTWSELNSNGFVPATFSAPIDPINTNTNAAMFNGTITIANATMTESYASHFKLVTVQVSWTSGNSANVTRQRAMQTIVSEFGLHNYYY